MSEKRIALCLTGTVGNVYTNKKKYEWSDLVDYRIALHFYKKHMQDINPNLDIFIHCWNKPFEKEIIEAYKPKIAQFEKQIDFPEHAIPADGSTFDDGTVNRRNFTRSRWYSYAQVLAMKREYEKRNDFKYDYVMTSRLDCAFLKDFNFSDYDNSKFWAPKDELDMDTCMANKVFLDYWFFSNSENMDKFGTLYHHLDELDAWKFKNIGHGLNSHEDSYKFVSEGLNLDIAYTLDESIDHDLVRAIYENCEYQGKTFTGVEKLTKYDKYPRGTGRF